MSRKPSSAPCPEIVLDWIAWYPDGDLADEVRGQIETHAAECSACRREIADLSGDGAGAPAPDARAERVFARTLGKIEGQPRRSPPPVQRGIWVVRPRLAVAAGLAVAILSGTAGVIAAQQLGGAVYETATARNDARPTSGPRLDVVFRSDASFAQIARAIQVLGANVESGPTPNGVVQLHLGIGADPVAAARRLESGDLAVADFAQPAP